MFNQRVTILDDTERWPDGVQVVAHYTMNPAEPDVGLFTRYAELDHLEGLNGVILPFDVISALARTNLEIYLEETHQ